MDALTHKDFAAFFRALWGFGPFPWQEDLLQRLAAGKDPRRSYDGAPGVWPHVLDLPTGSGKTAALDIAVFHLALEATKGEKRRAPVRIAFVVDRRLIVDDAYGRATTLARKLKEAIDAPSSADAIVRKVADALCGLSGSDQPLLARALRGGTPREDDWAHTPVQPTILCSTVDQVGSRLLFRGYGVSDSMKPIHAGLLGSDCLILLDEAHLAEPFRQTLAAVTKLRAPERDTAPFGFAVLTATPNEERKEEKGKPVFALSEADESDPTLSRRITASKPARLIEIAGKQGVETETRRAEVIAQEAKAVLDKLQASSIARPAVGVVVNRVARARAVFERLQAELKNAARIILLIGPARAVDRDMRAHDIEPIRTRHSEEPRQLPETLVIVATQTIEAGVDIDLDGLVTEAAALDALKQRFGRLNRAGRKIGSEAAILVHKDDLAAKADDPVYGDRIKTTWEKLKLLEAESDGVVDFGIEALKRRIDTDEAHNLAAPLRNAPILMPAYADLWSQTSPVPNADPDVTLFLHGPNSSSPSVQIVWRADITEQHDLRPAMEQESERKRLIELFKLMPPRAAEAIEVPLWAARAWLEQTRANQADFSDVAEREPRDATERGSGRRAFRWAGEDKDKDDKDKDRRDRRSRVIYASELNDRDLIVVPADYGGCDEWGWNPKSDKSVVDVADRAAWPYRARRLAVRVTPTLIAQGIADNAGDGASSVDHAAIADKLTATLAEHQNDRNADDVLAAILDLEILPRMLLPRALKEQLEKLQRPEPSGSEQPERRRGRLEPEFDAYGKDADGHPRGIVFVVPRGLHVSPGVDHAAAVPATESEDLSVSSDRSVPLIVHCSDVRAWAESFATRAGLPANQYEAVALAAYLHDPGKADTRFQSFLVGGDPYGPDAAEPLAKSGRARLPAGAWERAGLPDNWRHEALSVRLAMLLPDFTRANDRELVLWLIGTHHGYGRPLFPHADDHDHTIRSRLLEAFGSSADLAAGHGPQSLAFDFEGRDWTQMFDALKKRYGVWGLARLEAFVRLADHRASEEEASPDAARPYREAAE